MKIYLVQIKFQELDVSTSSLKDTTNAMSIIMTHFQFLEIKRKQTDIEWNQIIVEREIVN